MSRSKRTGTSSPHQHSTLIKILIRGGDVSRLLLVPFTQVEMRQREKEIEKKKHSHFLTGNLKKQIKKILLPTSIIQILDLN